MITNKSAQKNVAKGDKISFFCDSCYTKKTIQNSFSHESLNQDSRGAPTMLCTQLDLVEKHVCITSKSNIPASKSLKIS